MPGAGVAHALDRRLVGEEVAAVDRVLEVDVAGESPSPLVLTAALMPPCAQTECERFTGTSEKRSTVLPGLGELDDGHQAGEPAADDDESRFGHGCSRLAGSAHRSDGGRPCRRSPPRAPANSASRASSTRACAAPPDREPPRDAEAAEPVARSGRAAAEHADQDRCATVQQRRASRCAATSSKA